MAAGLFSAPYHVTNSDGATLGLGQDDALGHELHIRVGDEIYGGGAGADGTIRHKSTCNGPVGTLTALKIKKRRGGALRRPGSGGRVTKPDHFDCIRWLARKVRKR